VKTARTKLRRKPSRGSHEREVIEAIFDEALVSHLGLIDDGMPVVIPTLHVRIGSDVYLHGSAASRALRESEGAEVCLTALHEASAKIRTGPPLDDAEDMELPVWAGVVGLRTVVEQPEPDAMLAAGIEPPEYLGELLRRPAGSAPAGSNEVP
jgi:hypothetical protein